MDKYYRHDDGSDEEYEWVEKTTDSDSSKLVNTKAKPSSVESSEGSVKSSDDDSV